MNRPPRFQSSFDKNRPFLHRRTSTQILTQDLEDIVKYPLRRGEPVTSPAKAVEGGVGGEGQQQQREGECEYEYEYELVGQVYEQDQSQVKDKDKDNNSSDPAKAKTQDTTEATDIQITLRKYNYLCITIDRIEHIDKVDGKLARRVDG